MRAVFMLLVLVMIGFGYLLSDNINTREELIQAQQQNTQMTQEMKLLQNERDVAIASLAKSEQRVVELTQKNIDQEGKIQQLNEENEGLKNQNAGLQKQIEALNVFKPFQPSLPKVLSLAIFLPIIPASLATTYVLVRYNKKHIPRKDVNKKSQRNTSVQLTEGEVKEIIRMRRMK